MKNTKILLIDNYDSFTYNLAHLLEEMDHIDLTVVRNTNIPQDVQSYDGVLVSPGPGIPKEAGQLMSFLKENIRKVPIFGVCLGHQAIAETLGGSLLNTSKVYHGVSAVVQNHRNDTGILQALGEDFQAGRYHSWVVNTTDFPEELQITATIEDGTIMAFQHKDYPVYGVQFHPESILTPHGKKILSNWILSLHQQQKTQ